MVITHDSSSLGAFLLLAINFQQPLFSLFLFFVLEQAADSSPDRYLDLTPAYRVPSLLCFLSPPRFFYTACTSSGIVFLFTFFPAASSARGHSHFFSSSIGLRMDSFLLPPPRQPLRSRRRAAEDAAGLLKVLLGERWAAVPDRLGMEGQMVFD